MSALQWAMVGVFCSQGWGGDVLHFKTRTVDTRVADSREEPTLHRVDPGRRRTVLQFDQAIAPWQIAELERRGASAIQLLPVHGMVLSWPVGAGLEGLGVKWIGYLAPEDKISPLLNAWEDRVAVESFPDVSERDIRVMAALVEVHVTSTHGSRVHVVDGGIEAAKRLAVWDGVAYLFPAPPSDAGWTVCATAKQSPGQYAAASGASWATSPPGPTELGYNLDLLAGTLTSEPPSEAIDRAFAEWARYGVVSFLRADSASSPRTLGFVFGRGHHGDPWPFDGRGGTLAHTFYPSPLYAEPIAGDVHLDADEDWAGSRDLYAVVLHEVGHALGLVHSDDRAAVMYLFYRKFAGLGASDIAALRSLYLARTAPEEDGSPLGLEIIEITKGTDDRISVHGRSWGGAAGPRLRWRVSSGEWSDAIGAYSWTIPAVPMVREEEVLTVEAWESPGIVSRAFRIGRDGSFEEAASSIEPPEASGSTRAGR